MVPYFLNALQILFHKYGSRSQISTMLEIKLRIFVQYDMTLGEFYNFSPFSLDSRHQKWLSLVWVTKMTRRQSPAAYTRGKML